MKRFFVLLILLLVISTTSCSTAKSNKNTQQFSNLEIIKELESIENISNLNDETIKALSVIIRTNQKNKTIFEKIEYTPKNKHIELLVNQTKNEVLMNKSKTHKQFSTNTNTWSKTIKKSHILTFLKKKNIKLSSIAKIKPNFSQNQTLESLSVGEKIISFEELKNEFDIPSNKITKIEQNISSITLFGLHNNFIYYNITELDANSQKFSDYKQLLKHFFNDFDLITEPNFDC